MRFKEEEIQKMMKNLDLSREEAIQLLIDDREDTTTELDRDQAKVASRMMRADSKPRDCKRKPNETRRFIMAEIANGLGNFGCKDVNITNLERELTFVYNGETYRLSLAKPRKEKE